jgi:hypothetical protein
MFIWAELNPREVREIAWKENPPDFVLFAASREHSVHSEVTL